MCKVLDFNIEKERKFNLGACKLQESEYKLNEYELVKITSYILFFANNTQTKLYKTKLNKLLFYLQFLHGKKYDKKRLLQDDFICNHFGPTYPCLEEILSILKSKKLITIKNSHYGEYVVANYKLNDDNYNIEEITVLSEVANMFSLFTSAEISEYSHREKLWYDTKIGDVIDFDRAELLNEFYYT